MTCKSFRKGLRGGTFIATPVRPDGRSRRSRGPNAPDRPGRFACAPGGGQMGGGQMTVRAAGGSQLRARVEAAASGTEYGRGPDAASDFGLTAIPDGFEHRLASG